MKPTPELIASPQQHTRDEVRERIAKAEERIAVQDKAIAELKAKIAEYETSIKPVTP